jgi:hypothetical protein
VFVAHTRKPREIDVAPFCVDRFAPELGSIHLVFTPEAEIDLDGSDFR